MERATEMGVPSRVDISISEVWETNSHFKFYLVSSSTPSLAKQKRNIPVACRKTAVKRSARASLTAAKQQHLRAYSKTFRRSRQTVQPETIFLFFI